MFGLCLIFILLIVGAMAYAPAGLSQSLPPAQTQGLQTPLEILKTRYGRGEITREEYDEVRRDLAG